MIRILHEKYTDGTVAIIFAVFYEDEKSEKTVMVRNNDFYYMLVDLDENDYPIGLELHFNKTLNIMRTSDNHEGLDSNIYFKSLKERNNFHKKLINIANSYSNTNKEKLLEEIKKLEEEINNQILPYSNTVCNITRDGKLVGHGDLVLMPAQPTTHDIEDLGLNLVIFGEPVPWAKNFMCNNAQYYYSSLAAYFKEKEKQKNLTEEQWNMLSMFKCSDCPDCKQVEESRLQKMFKYLTKPELKELLNNLNKNEQNELLSGLIQKIEKELEYKKF